MLKIQNILKTIIFVVVFPIGLVYLIYTIFFGSRKINIISSNTIRVDNMPKVNKDTLNTAINKSEDILKKMEEI